MKKLIAGLLAFVMLGLMLPQTQVFAETEERTGWGVPLGEPRAKVGDIEETKIEVPDVDPDKLTAKKVYKAMIAKKADFPEGMTWTNDNYYEWYGGYYSGGFGCAGFAFLLSDAAFGKLPCSVNEEFEYEDLRVGDILRINNDTHSVIILKIDDDGVTIAEGNYNASIHWGRWMSRDYVEQSDYVMTRWPDTFKPEKPWPYVYYGKLGKPVLEWGRVDGAAKYQVYRKAGKSGEFKKIKTLKGTKFRDSTAEEGKTYFYKVRAVSKYGVKGEFCGKIKAKAKKATAAPKVTGSYNSKGKPVLDWKDVSGAIRYQVYRSESKNGTYTRIRTVVESEYTDKKAEAGKTYYYKVCAKNEYGLRSKYSKVVKMKVE